MKLFRVVLPLASVIALGAAGAAIGAADQVLATVDGEDITSAQLRQEMGNAPGNPAADNAALQGLIDRKLLAAEARKRGLDKTPMGAMLLKRADEFAVVEILGTELAGPPSPVPAQDVTAFISAHPTMFAQRRLITLNQFVVNAATPELLKRLKPLETMAAFEDVLLQDRVQYTRGAKILDTIDVEPAAAAQISALKPGQVFITPHGTRLELSEISASNPVPISGEAAQQISRTLLTTQQTGEKVRAAVSAIVASAKDQVKINPDYAGKTDRERQGGKPGVEATSPPPA